MPPVLPRGFDAFVDQVVPILQARGLFRTEYAGTTLRDHYGLRPPAASQSRAGSRGTPPPDVRSEDPA